MARQPVMAGRREASFYERPDTYAPKRVHIANGPMAACDRTILLQERLVEAARIPRASRCRRAGCAALWPEEGA